MNTASPSASPSAVAWIGLQGPGPGWPSQGQEATAAQPPAGPVVRFEDSDDFLLSAQAHGFGAYVVESAQRGVSAPDLLRLVRRRTDAPLLLLSARQEDDFIAGLQAGADMVLPAPWPAAHVAAALAAVQRRRQAARAADDAWTLDGHRRELRAPDGTAIALTETDVAILQACAEGAQRRVSREALLQRLWGGEAQDMDNALHATVYRLRKRVEKNGRLLSPLQAVPRVGYEFRAPLRLA